MLDAIAEKAAAFFKENKGATATEYAIIIAFLIAVIIVTVLVLQDKSTGVFNSVGNQAGQFGKIN